MAPKKKRICKKSVGTSVSTADVADETRDDASCHTISYAAEYPDPADNEETAREAVGDEARDNGMLGGEASVGDGAAVGEPPVGDGTAAEHGTDASEGGQEELRRKDKKANKKSSGKDKHTDKAKNDKHTKPPRAKVAADSQKAKLKAAAEAKDAREKEKERQRRGKQIHQECASTVTKCAPVLISLGSQIKENAAREHDVLYQEAHTCFVLLDSFDKEAKMLMSQPVPEFRHRACPATIDFYVRKASGHIAKFENMQVS
jgi:hypothetical protein